MRKIILLRALPWLVGAGIFVLVLGISNWMLSLDADVHDKQLKNVIQARIIKNAAQFQKALDNNLIILDAIESLLLMNNQIRQREFEVLATRFLSTRTSIRQVQLSPNAIITNIYPPIEQHLIGQNLHELADHKAAVIRSIREKKLYVFGPIRLSQGGTGFVAHKPLFDREGLETKFWGFISVIIDADIFFDEIALQSEDNIAYYRVIDKGTDKTTNSVLLGSSNVQTVPDLTHSIYIPNGHWLIEARIKPDINAHGVPHLLLELWFFVLSMGCGLMSAHGCNLLRRIYLKTQTDSLTGLLNRQHFRYETEEAINGILQADMPVSMVIVDLKNFKLINEKFGSHTGDALIQQVATHLEQTLPANGVLGRFNGEQYILILPGVDLSSARNYAENVAEALDKPIFIYGSLVGISVNIGLAQQTKSTFNFDRLVSQTETALQRAKQNSHHLDSFG